MWKKYLKFCNNDLKNISKNENYFSIKNELKYNISTTWGLKKIWNYLQEILLIKSFPTIPKAQCLNFAKIFNFDIVKNSLAQNCSIFNNSCIISLNTTKPPKCTPTHQGLSNSTKSMMEKIGLRDLNVTNKTNKSNKLSASFNAHNLKLNIEWQIALCKHYYQWIHKDIRHASWKSWPSHHITCLKHAIVTHCPNHVPISKGFLKWV